MGNAESPSNPPDESLPARTTSGTETAFGIELKRLKTTYSFRVVDLIAGGLTLHQTQRLSRLSKNPSLALSMTPDSREQLVEGTTRAIIFRLEGSERVTSDLLPKLEERIRTSLHTAIRLDAEAAAQYPLAIDVARRLVDVTGRSLAQLDLDLDDPTIREVIQNMWNLKKKTENE